MTTEQQKIVSRLFQFIAGPQRQRFYACERHAPLLDSEPPSSAFMCLEHEHDQHREIHDQDDQLNCDYCRGENGP